jgi:type I restriction enzyme S subunit
MKEVWRTTSLGEVLAVMQNGLNCKQNKNGQGEKISRIESISGAIFDSGRVGYADLSQRDKERYRLQPGDILFSHINSAPHVGKTAVFDA